MPASIWLGLLARYFVLLAVVGAIATSLYAAVDAEDQPLVLRLAVAAFAAVVLLHIHSHSRNRHTDEHRRTRNCNKDSNSRSCNGNENNDSNPRNRYKDIHIASSNGYSNEHSCSRNRHTHVYLHASPYADHISITHYSCTRWKFCKSSISGRHNRSEQSGHCAQVDPVQHRWCRYSTQ